MNIIGTNIISSLGFTTDENFENVKRGISGIKHYDVGTFDLPEAFVASLIDKERLNDEFSAAFGCRDAACHVSTKLTNLEKATILSVFTANKEAQIDLSSERTIFILSTTKGNVDLLDMRQAICDKRYATSDVRQATGGKQQSQIANRKSQIYLWHTAELITDFFKNPNTPIVVSNACISSVAAQITAMRELQTGNYDYAVVVGVDFLSKFIISGFQSFKALSPELCRPFDKERCGLNLGEAAATIIFGKCDMRNTTSDMRCATCDKEQSQIANRKSQIVLLSGAIRNDANHISAPSRTGEGSYRALQYVLSQDATSDMRYETEEIAHRTSHIAFINAHGTSTPYNDAMEVNAIVRAGLENVPVNSLKAFFGHTLGAAGILESIISIQALSEGTILKSLGFEENEQLTINNEQFTLNVCQENMATDKKYFVKMMSGFGGVNAALLFCDMRNTTGDMRYATCDKEQSQIANLFIKKHIKLSFKDSEEMTECYRSLQVDYPKFFKMDGLSKLGFLASEMLLNSTSDKRYAISDMRQSDIAHRTSHIENPAIICFNRSSSLEIDTQYQDTIRDNDNYFPSPLLFVYTLPNIVAGEIAIRNKFFSETFFYLCSEFDARQIVGTVKNAFLDKTTTAVLAAWVEHFEEKCEVFMALVESGNGGVEFAENQLNLLYNT